MKFFLPVEEDRYLSRCFDLARLGAGKVSPNPMVGAVLVYEGRIIGEGYHRQWGGPHAEVEAIRSVSEADRILIPMSTLYVSLEPCCTTGRTPPCTDLIIESGIPRVVIANLDKTPGVNGLGIKQLEQAGVEVHQGIRDAEGLSFSKIRNTFVTKERPFILLKYAQSEDGFLGPEGKALWMTNEVSRRLLHKWRSETDAILVGTKTLLIDNPSLTNRFFFGKSPVRLVLDKNGTLPGDLKVLSDQQAPTWIFTENPGSFSRCPENVRVVSSPFGKEFFPFLMKYLAKEGISSLLVEGGQQTLSAFLHEGLWDETRIFTAPLQMGKGLKAPVPGSLPPSFELDILGDRLQVWENKSGADR